MWYGFSGATRRAIYGENEAMASLIHHVTMVSVLRTESRKPDRAPSQRLSQGRQIIVTQFQALLPRKWPSFVMSLLDRKYNRNILAYQSHIRAHKRYKAVVPLATRCVYSPAPPSLWSTCTSQAYNHHLASSI